jgi:hypothetical protein
MWMKKTLNEENYSCVCENLCDSAKGAKVKVPKVPVPQHCFIITKLMRIRNRGS